MAAAASTAPALRRSRRGLGLALIVAGMLLMGALGGWWLLGSQGARDLALQQVIDALPVGALRIGAREGSIAGGLRLRDIVYENETIRIEVDLLQATPRLPGLRVPALNLAALQLRGVRVALKPSPAQPTPSWPALLPTLDLPLALQIDAFELRDGHVVAQAAAETGAVPPLRLDRVAGRLWLSSGRLVLESLHIKSPQGRLQGRLAYAPADDFAMQLDLHAALTTGAQLALALDGDLARGRATLEGSAGGPLSISADWQDAHDLQTLAWTLEARAESLQPATLGVSSVAQREPLDLALRVRGGLRAGSAAVATQSAPGLRIAVDGNLAQGDRVVQMRASQLRWHQDVLYAEPLALSLLDGRLDLDGSYRIGDGAMAFDARIDGLSWGEGEDRVRADGEAVLHGVADDWRAELALELAHGVRRARLEGVMHGDAAAITLAPFRLTTPGGFLEGEGRYALDATAAFSLDANLHEVDPAWLLPGWPGALRGGQRVSGRAELDVIGDTLRIDTELALGDGRVIVSGTLAPTLDLSARLHTLDVSPWLADTRGVLDGRLRLYGSPSWPAFEGDLVLLDGGWGAMSMQRASLRGALPMRGAGRLEAHIANFAHGAKRVEAIELNLDGSVGAGDFSLALRGIDAPMFRTTEPSASGHASAQGTWMAEPGLGRGSLSLDALQIALSQLPTIALTEASRIDWREHAKQAHWRLPQPVCLGVGERGRLCAEGDIDEQRVQGEALDLAWLTPFLAGSADTPLTVSGLISLEALRRSGKQGAISSLRLEAPQGRIGLGGATGEPTFGWNDLVLDAAAAQGWRVALSARLSDQGRVDARVEANTAGELDGELTLRSSDLAVLELLSADLAAPRGLIEGRLRILGSTAAPRWSGNLAAAPFAVELPALGIAITDGELRIEGDENGRLRLLGRLPTGDGVLELSGQGGDGTRPSALSIRGTDVRVLDTPDGRAWISPALELEIADGIASLRGHVEVPRAAFQLERFEQGVNVSADVVVLDDPAITNARSGPALDADFTLALGEDVRLRGFGFDGRLSGELRIRDRIDRDLRARGTLELAGEVRAYGQQLDLTRGVLRWGNVPINDPMLDVRAMRPDSVPEVGIAVSGTATEPVVEVWSQPPLPQAEALSWLMFGRPLAGADGEDAVRLQQAATSLGGSALAQAVAGRVGLDTASVGESRVLGATALTVGKRITPRLYVRYGLSLTGTGQVITVTYAIRRWLAVQFETADEQRIELEARIDRE